MAIFNSKLLVYPRVVRGFSHWNFFKKILITGGQNWVHHFGGVLATVILWLVQFGLPHMSPNLEYPVNL